MRGLQLFPWLLAWLLAVPLLAQPPGTPEARESVGAAAPPELVVRHGGGLVFLSGATGFDGDGASGADGVESQTRRAVAKIEAALSGVGLDLSRLVSIDIFLADLQDFAAFWPALSASLNGRVPAGAAVGVGLATPGARVELAAVAALPSTKVRRVHPEGWAGADSEGSIATLAGDLLFVSGLAAFEPSTMSFRGGDVAAQTRLTMSNLQAVLAAAGLELRDVARCRVFLSDARDFAAMDRAYAAIWGEHPPPARSVVQTRLLNPENRFGVQCLAGRSPVRRRVASSGVSSGAPSGELLPPVVAGSHLFLSGSRGLSDPRGGGPRDSPERVRAQAERALDSVLSSLEAAGGDASSVLEATVYLADLSHARVVRGVLEDAFGAEPTAVVLVGTPWMEADAVVEIAVTASRPAASR